jgi:hypothetical protein
VVVSVVGAGALCALAIVFLRRGIQAAVSSSDIDENEDMTSWTTDPCSINATDEGRMWIEAEYENPVASGSGDQLSVSVSDHGLFPE